MDNLAKTIGILCVSVMAMGILYNLGSFAVTDKVIKFVISVYIIVAVFGSLKDVDFKVKTDGIVADIYQQDMSDMLKSEIILQTEKDLTEIVKKRLEEKNISYNDISLHILEQNGSLEIKKIMIDCPETSKQAVLGCLQDLVTEDTQIVTGE